MAFKMRGFSAFTKNDDDKKASSILKEELNIGDDGKVKFVRGTGVD